MNVRGIMLSASLPPENKKCRIRVDMNLIHYPLILHFYILCNPCISNPTNYFNIASLILSTIYFYCCPVKLLLISTIRADTSHEVSTLLVIFVFAKK